MNQIDQINHNQIIIVTNYRTGGTAFGETICRTKGIPGYFTEPEYDSHQLEELQTAIDENCEFVLKIVAYQIKNYKIYQDLLANPNIYKIKLSRRDSLHQYASEYVGLMTEVWHHYKTVSANENSSDHYVADDYYYTVPIDDEMIHQAQFIITECQKDLDSLSVKWDQEIFYEDLDHFDTNNKITVKPANYDEILDVFRSRGPVFLPYYRRFKR